MNKKLQKQLLMAAVIFGALYLLMGRSAFAKIGDANEPTGLWKLERKETCESQYSDSTGKMVCGVADLVQKNIHGQQ